MAVPAYFLVVVVSAKKVVFADFLERFLEGFAEGAEAGLVVVFVEDDLAGADRATAVGATPDLR